MTMTIVLQAHKTKVWQHIADQIITRTIG